MVSEARAQNVYQLAVPYLSVIQLVRLYDIFLI
jgi:hypothetical protein